MNKVTAIVIALVFALAPGSALAGGSGLYAIYWPKDLVTSAKDLGIIEVHVAMTCGQFRAIKNIPQDWSALVVSPASERTQLNLSSGHGASHLANLSSLNGAIVVQHGNDSCFGISVNIAAQTQLSNVKVRLVKVSGGS